MTAGQHHNRRLGTFLFIAGLSAPATSNTTESRELHSDPNAKTEPEHGELTHAAILLAVVFTLVVISRLHAKFRS